MKVSPYRKEDTVSRHISQCKVWYMMPTSEVVEGQVQVLQVCHI